MDVNFLDSYIPTESVVNFFLGGNRNTWFYV